MPDTKLLKLPSSEGAFIRDQGDLQTLCSSRRRSCALVNNPTPCVNKALCHIQELKTKLEHWGQKGGNAQHETENENNHNNVWKCVSTEGRAADVSTELCIEGLGLHSPGSEVLTPLWKETVDVLAEVLRLIDRLELDRRDAELAFLEEKEKAKKLLMKKDSLDHWKQQEFPIEMKKERDACSTDIAELTWQLTISRDQLPQVRDRLTRREGQSRRLNEDMDFMRKHGPLVEERLQMENEIMKHILTAESEASETFTKVSHELKGFQQTFKEEQFRADTEKQKMNRRIKTMGKQLSDKVSELHQLQSQCEIFHTSIKKSEEKVTLRDSQIKALLQEICQFERQEMDINDAVMTLKEKIEDKEEMFRKTKKHILQLQEQVQMSKHEGDEKISELHAILSQKRRDLLSLRAENEDHKLQIEDYKKKIRQSEQAVRQLQKDHERLLLKISLNGEQRKEAKAELDRVSNHHSSTKAELEHLEQQTFLQELRNRKEIEMMKKQITDEMKDIAILQENVATVTEEYNCTQTHCKQVKAELQKNFEDASSTTARLEAKVEQLRHLYTEKSQTIENARANLSAMHAAHTHLTEEFEKKKKEHQKHLNSLKESLHVVLLRFEEITNRLKVLRLKSEEFKKASDVMEETVSTMPELIEEIQSISDSVAFKHGTAKVVMGSLNSDITSCAERKSRHANMHSALFTQRQAVLKDTEANLQQALKENLVLAEEYQSLQKSLMIARQEAVYVVEKRNMAESCIHHHKQLSLLQKRMHEAMAKYFKHRSVHSQAELARFQALSNQNNQKMKALQEELSNAIYCLSEFLLALTDDSTTSHVPQQANRPGQMPMN